MLGDVGVGHPAATRRATSTSRSERAAAQVVRRPRPLRRDPGTAEADRRRADPTHLALQLSGGPARSRARPVRRSCVIAWNASASGEDCTTGESSLGAASVEADVEADRDASRRHARAGRARRRGQDAFRVEECTAPLHSAGGEWLGLRSRRDGDPARPGAGSRQPEVRASRRSAGGAPASWATPPEWPWVHGVSRSARSPKASATRFSSSRRSLRRVGLDLEQPLARIPARVPRRAHPRLQ